MYVASVLFGNKAKMHGKYFHVAVHTQHISENQCSDSDKKRMPISEEKINIFSGSHSSLSNINGTVMQIL